MSVRIHHTPTLALDIERCDQCGKYWGSEPNWRAGVCPICARIKIDAAFKAEVSANRRANALKGVINRMRKRK